MFYAFTCAPNVLNPAFIALYPYADEKLRKAALITYPVSAIPLSNDAYFDKDARFVAFEWLKISDHYIGRIFEYGGDYSKLYPAQKATYDWASFVSGKLMTFGSCCTNKFKLDTETFWTSKALLFEDENHPDLDDGLFNFLHDGDYNEWHVGMPVKKSRLITAIKHAQSVEFNPNCKEFVLNSLSMMLDDLD